MESKDSKRLIAPCVTACPAAIDIPRYIGYAGMGRFAEADAVVRESIPLPTVCGLICYRPCEPWCRRGIMEEPVAINAIKRAAGEHDASRIWRQRWAESIGPPTGKRVAVVGSGPTGLTATYYLAKRKGHGVTLLEAMPELGGQLRTGLPEYKVPREQLRQDIDLVTETRVEVRTSALVESLDPLMSEFDAVFLAIGQMRARALGVPGEQNEGIMQADEFLRRVNLGDPPAVGSRVVVFGGNNIAVDSARCAVRLGASEVTIAVPGPRSSAQAYEFEQSDAEQEGVRFMELAAPFWIGGSESGLRLTMQRLRVTATNEWGHATVEPEPGTAFGLRADLVLVSAGQDTAAPDSWGVRLDPSGTIRADSETLVTSRPGVFAGGDAVTGPDSIVEAMAQGKKAAAAIDIYLGGNGDISEHFAPEAGDEMTMPAHLAEQGKPVGAMPRAGVRDRRTTFKLVDSGYSRDQAVAEAERCIRCDLWRQGAPEVWNKQKG